MSHFEDAPNQTDCLTAVAYLIFKATREKIPITYIGDMPRELEAKGWSILHIPSDELQDGDLVFCKNKKAHRRIHHVALYAHGKLVHSCRSGMQEETPDKYFSRFIQPYSDDEGRCLLTHFFDQRNFRRNIVE